MQRLGPAKDDVCVCVCFFFPVLPLTEKVQCCGINLYEPVNNPAGPGWELRTWH